jgi:type IV fimbrial biogenesis protein FimT
MLEKSIRGMTLLEVMITLSIIAIVAAVTIPSFSDFILNQRAKGAAEALVAALQNAKAESVKTNSEISIVFKPGTTNAAHSSSSWCYGMTIPSSTSCDCSASPSDCATGSVVDGDSFKDVTINFNSSDKRTIEPIRGGAANATQGTVIFDAGNNKKLGVTLSTIGRIRMCLPTGTTISRYTDSGACP